MKRAEKYLAEMQSFGGSGQVAILRKFPDTEFFRVPDQLSENLGPVRRAVELEADRIRTHDQQHSEDEEDGQHGRQAAQRSSKERRWTFLSQHVFLFFSRFHKKLIFLFQDEISILTSLVMDWFELKALLKNFRSQQATKFQLVAVLFINMICKLNIKDRSFLNRCSQNERPF